MAPQRTGPIPPNRVQGVACVLAALAILMATALHGACAQSPSAPPANRAFALEFQGVIGVASASFVTRGLERAQTESAQLVIIRMDTPGGLVNATREIIGAILGSTVPVVVFVAPSGARAASAGTYIVYASHIAAMASGTHIGAATPISLGGTPGLPGSPEPRDKPKEKDDDKGGPANASERKSINDAAAYLRTLAQLRGRNPDFAERAVRDAATMTAREALDAKVVEVLADSTEDLLAAIDGRSVSIAGAERTISTKNISLTVVSPDWRTKAIAIVTDPNVAYLLMLIGFYGILFEIWNPGFVFPGVAGGICLLIALAALAVMPVSYAGLALIVLGIALMIAEIFTPGVLVLGIGGVVAFVVGSIFLFDPDEVSFGFGVGWPVIAAATITTAAFMFAVLGFALKARRRPVVTGIEQMIGSTGEVTDWSSDEGRIRVHGEIWHARTAPHRRPPSKGAKVRIVALDGLTAVVESEKITKPLEK